jgi:hypothetical protein
VISSFHVAMSRSDHDQSAHHVPSMVSKTLICQSSASGRSLEATLLQIKLSIGRSGFSIRSIAALV